MKNVRFALHSVIMIARFCRFQIIIITACATCLLLLPTNLFSQWTTLNAPTGDHLRALDFVGNTMVVGSYQTLFKSADDGASWTPWPLLDETFTTIYGSWVYDVHFFDQNTAVATGFILTGNSEVILRTTNGGATWSMVSVFNGGDWPRLLNDIAFPTATTGYAVGSNGRILKTANAGQSWTPLNSGTTQNLYAVHFMNATTGIAVGDAIALKTTNGGANWTKTDLFGYLLRDVHFTNATVGIAVGVDAVLKTVNGGNTWTLQPGIADNLNAVWMADADTVFAGGSTIYKSVNGGQYFLPQPSVPGQNINKLVFLNNKTGYATGDNGKLFKTGSAGDPFPRNDAGIAEIEAFPYNPCPDIFPVSVRVKNIGLNPLTKATVNWEVNGQPQPPYLWTGNLAPGDTSGFVTIGSYYFPLGNNAVTVHTTCPNGVADQFQGNDAQQTTFPLGRLSGTYTIGGANPDFPTISAAVNAIYYPGACGQVVFNVRNGTYTEAVTIPALQFVPASAEVIFQSESGNSQDVTLTYPGTTLRFDGASNITFRNMTIKGDGTTFIRAIEMKNGANNIRILNNVLEGKPTNYGTEDYAVVWAGGPDIHDIFIGNNLIKDGSIGVALSGTASSYGVNNIVERNTFLNQHYQGVYCTAQSAPRISGNRITSNSTELVSSTAGVYIERSSGDYRIEKNRVSMTAGAGLFIWGCNPNGEGTGWLTNNFIESGVGNNPANGIRIERTLNVNIYYNTVHLSGSNTFVNTAVYFYMDVPGSLAHINMQNNAIKHSGPGLIYGGASFDSLDYNAYFWKGKIFAESGITGLTQWKVVLNKDNHSFVADPQFIPGSELYIIPQTSNYLLNGAAQPIAAVTDDIDGEPRDPLRPDIGADEFVQPAADIGVAGMLNTALYCPGIQPIYVRIQNYGADPLQTAQIHWSVAGVEQTPYSWNGNLVSGSESPAIEIGAYNFVAGQAYTLEIWTGAPNGKADEVVSNDAFSVSVAGGGLSGAFTIGGGGADYPTFNDARAELTSKGVCGPVAFKVRPGTYTEQVSFTPVSGASPINTITFESENGDSSSVLLTFDANNTKSYTMQLDGADYFTFKNLTFSAINKSYNTLVYLKNSANHNRFLNNRFIGLTDPLNYYEDVLVDTDLSLDEFNRFEGNIFRYGYYGIRIRGNLKNIGGVITHERGNALVGNTIEGSKGFGIYMDYQQDPLVEKNTVPINVAVWANTGSTGIYLAFCIGKIRVLKNKVAGTVQTGIWAYGCSSNNLAKGLIVNNFVSILGSPKVSSAMSLDASFAQQVCFNNLLIYGTTNEFVTTFLINAPYGRNNSLMNNNIINLSTTGAIYAPLADIATSDYNNFFTAGGPLAKLDGFEYFDLTSMQNATGLDLHSLNIDPQFVSNTDLHLSGVNALQEAGIEVPGIMDDIDGDLRNPLKPDIGADELTIVRAIMIAPGEDFALSIYPNPYAGSTQISYVLGKKATVRIEVFNTVGQPVATLINAAQPAGHYLYHFSAAQNGLQAGIYFAKVTVNGQAITKKIVEMR